MGCDSVELEYQDGRQWIMAFRNSVGISIGSHKWNEVDPIFKEIAVLKRKKRVNLGGVTYRLLFSKYESFAEWVQVIQLRIDRDNGAKR